MNSTLKAIHLKMELAYETRNYYRFKQKIYGIKNFLTTAKLNVFSLLSEHPMSAQEIAHEIQVTLRGITILLNAFVPMGLLEKRDERYNCHAKVTKLLSKDSPTSIMPMVMLHLEDGKDDRI